MLYYRWLSSVSMNLLPQNGSILGLLIICRQFLGVSVMYKAGEEKTERLYCRIGSRVSWFDVRLRRCSLVLVVRDGCQWHRSLPCRFPSMSSRAAKGRRWVVSHAALRVHYPVSAGETNVGYLVVSMYDTREAETVGRNWYTFWPRDSTHTSSVVTTSCETLVTVSRQRNSHNFVLVTRVVVFTFQVEETDQNCLWNGPSLIDCLALCINGIQPGDQRESCANVRCTSVTNPVFAGCQIYFCCCCGVATFKISGN